MTLLTQLPDELEDVEAFIKRRSKAAERKEMWRPYYRDCYRFAMPTRETFNWHTEGQKKENILYDSTLQETTYTAANTMVALLFPGWSRWAELAPGGAVDPAKITSSIRDQLQKATDIFFSFLNNSNFAQVINECALDLLVGTGGLSFDEGDNDQPFLFTAIPLSAIELEEGPNGMVETTFMEREPLARNLVRMYAGMEEIDLPKTLTERIKDQPDSKVKIIQGEVYYPKNGHYYGIVALTGEKEFIWRYDFDKSCPSIIARATKVAGELYGRGRIMLALSDARTLDKMQEFILRNAALQIGQPLTGVSDGVMNPYTAVIAPNVVIPVASNDSQNPSLRPLEIGGNFQVTETIVSALRENVRRVMLGPEPTQGAVRSATEVGVNDRNRLWAMNGEFSRIQAELLAKIVARGVFILQRKGILQKFKLDGRQVAVKYTSPFAKSQAAQDVAALQNTLGVIGPLGPAVVAQGMRVENFPHWVGRKFGVPEELIRTDAERQQLVQAAAQAQKDQQAAAAPPIEPGAVPAGSMLAATPTGLS